MKVPVCLQRIRTLKEEAHAGDEQEQTWRQCGLHLSEICNAELVPDAFVFSKGSDEVKCAWIRSQLIGSRHEVLTPFGKRRITYADYTASGRCLLHVENFILNNIMPYYGNTHTEDSFVGCTTSHLVKESKRFIKSCLGGTDDDALMFCGSGTTAAIKRLQDVMGISISSVLREELGLSHRRTCVVYVGPYEHHSNLLSWRQSLAEVVEIPADEQGMIDYEYLEEALQDPSFSDRPKLGSFSACSNVTGILTDTRRIARLLHEHGAFACFDFASSGPYLEIDMRSTEPDGYDAVFLSPHKFVGGPGTPGVLLMNKKLYNIKHRAPTIAGGGVVDFVNCYTEKDTLYVQDIEERESAGTQQILQQIKAAMAFWIKEAMGTRMIKTKEKHFITVALKRLSTNPNIRILGNVEVERQAILSFLVYDGRWERGRLLQSRFVVKLLSDLFGIQARGGCSCAGPYGHALLDVDVETSLKFRNAIAQGYEGVKLGWCRLNFAYFISEDEFEFILGAIEFIARYGGRFIPMYDFDWKSGSWTVRKTFATLSCVNKICMSQPGLFQLYLKEARALADQISPLQQMTVERNIPDKIDRSLINFRL